MRKDYKIITEDSLISAGYKVRLPKRKCNAKYFVNDNEEYVLVQVQEEGKREWVIIDKDTYEQIGGKGIYMNRRKDTSPYLPCIWLDTKVFLHTFVLRVYGNHQVDHINQCQKFCVLGNLRECTQTENNMNRHNSLNVGIVKSNDVYVGYNYTIDVEASNKDFIDWLAGEGFVCDTCGKKIVTMRSKIFENEVDCYINSTVKYKKLYEGTRLEEFVYDITNDFRDTMYLLVHHYILHDISYKEMRQMNEEYWRSKSVFGKLLF